MKKIIARTITILTIMIMVLTLAAPVTIQAKAKPKLNKTAITLSVKNSYQLKVNGTKAKATWKTSNAKVAVVSKNGKVTAKKAGKAVVTAKINRKTYKCKVTVKVVLNKTAITLNEKKVYQLKVNGTKKKPAWKTSNAKIAVVSKNGKVTAKKAGKAIITAKVNGKTYKCKVTVKAASKIGLNKTKVALSIYETKSYQLKVNGTKVKPTWKTSNAKVAVVSKNGKVTAKNPGNAVITAKVGSKVYKCSVTVSDKHKCVWEEHYKTIPKQTWHGEKRKAYVLGCSCGLAFETGDEWSNHSLEMSFAQEKGVLIPDLTTDYWKRTPEEFDTFLRLCKKQGEQHSWGPGEIYVGDYYTIDGYEEYMDGKYCKICGDFTGEWWRWE